MARKYTSLILLLAVVTFTHSWELPSLPTGKRSQYFVQHDDGGYKYGYDTGIDHFAKQAGDANNEVAGHYVYKDPSGQNIDIKYTAGVNGFVPEGLEKILHQAKGPYAASQEYHYPAPTAYSNDDSTDDQANTGDASYSFTIDTDTYKRQESSDPSGNVQGKYSYTNEAGQHDLSYIAGSNTGFVATSGSLAQPNGLERKTVVAPSMGYPAGRTGQFSYAPASHSISSNKDGSYSFEYSTNDQSRQESSDASGNVQGRYSFTNEAGTHDLSYVAGSETGFKPTGGSLAHPNGLVGKSTPYSSQVYMPSIPYSAGRSSVAGAYTPATQNVDGSYSFGYSTNDQSRHESSDASGNVQGRYSFTNEAGTHDLSYVAGSETGFQPTGGSLALANGLAGKSGSTAPGASSGYLPPASGYSNEGIAPQTYTPTVPNTDGSYSFSYSTKDQSRQENSDASGNVQGRYSFTNEAGTHDLSYVAGSQTGFLPTGGSLSAPNGLTGNAAPSTYAVTPVTYASQPSGYTGTSNDDDQADTGDASYSFTIDTDEYKRQETSDAKGNVQGTYSYKNAAGSHDLSFVAGSQTGFLPTGGSLLIPNGLTTKNIPTTYSAAPVTGTYLPPASYSQDDESTPGDASYSFTIDTDEYSRKESSDVQGNVMGTYSYKNKEGSHDLSYVAGSNTGFVPTSGSLAVPNGILGSRFAGPYASSDYTPPQIKTSDYLAATSNKASFSHGKVGNVFLKSYYPSKSQSKYGYIFESV